MQRVFSDLVVSRGGAAARRPGLALPASLALHAAAATLVGFVAVLRQDAPPRVETPPGHIPGFIPPPPLGGAQALRPGPPRLPRPTPPHAMVVVPERPAPPEPEDVGGPVVPDIAPNDPPCLGCEPGGVPDGVPGGAPGADVSAPAPTGPVRTGGDIHPPLKVRSVVPVYPEIARAAHVQGDVVLDCTISNEGRVVDIKVLSGHPLLQGAAVDAVRQWLYRPTLLNGVPIPVVMTVTLHFTIDRLLLAPLKPRGLDATLPQPPGPTAPSPPPGPIVLTVEEATFALNSAPVADIHALDERLKELLDSRSDRTVFVRASGRVRYGRVVEAMDAARGAGADRIGILGPR